MRGNRQHRLWVLERFSVYVQSVGWACNNWFCMCVEVKEWGKTLTFIFIAILQMNMIGCVVRLSVLSLTTHGKLCCCFHSISLCLYVCESDQGCVPSATHPFLSPGPPPPLPLSPWIALYFFFCFLWKLKNHIPSGLYAPALYSDVYTVFWPTAHTESLDVPRCACVLTKLLEWCRNFHFALMGNDAAFLAGNDTKR